MPNVLIKTEDCPTPVNALHALVKIIDHLREDPVYTDQERELGISSAENVIKVLKLKTGNQQIVRRQ